MNLLSRIPSIRPVSYTHLDVYKRQHRDTGCFGSGKFRVIRMDRSGINNHIDIRCDILGTLAIGCLLYTSRCV